MSKGLYFYKLVSPYKEDVTKDCKLTINEIDSNFITLKDADVKDLSFNEEEQTIILTKNDGEVLEADLTSMFDGIVRNLRVDYNKEEGEIVINYNGERTIIDGIITKENLSKKILTEVASDNTLTGFGTYGKPLGIKNVEKTGQVEACKRFINAANGEQLPNPKNALVGDRYVTLEKVSEYGYLYDFKAVSLINSDIKCGWRVPSKEDWDNILNAIEPCERFRNHESLLCNKELGKIAGKLLKSRTGWLEAIYDGSCEKPNNSCDCDCNKSSYNSDYMRNDELTNSQCDKVKEDDEFDIEDIKQHPKEKKIPAKGVDWYNVRLLPAGYGDGCQLMDYFGKRGAYWTSTMIDNTDVYVKRFDYRLTGVMQTAESPRSVFSLRLVKDYDGSNFNEVEYINGQYYPCVLVPCLNSNKGFIIITAVNIGFDDPRYHPVKVAGECASLFKPKFFTTEWNGCYWDRKLMKEGDSVVLFKGLEDDKEYNEYRLIGGKLVSATKKLQEEVTEGIKNLIDKVQENLDEEIERAKERENEIEEKLNAEIERVDGIDEKLDAEIERVDGIEEKLDAEIERVDGIEEKVNSEIERAKEREDIIEGKIDEEVERATARENEIEEKLNAEIERVDGIEEKLDSEIERAIERENEIDSKLDAEIERSVEEDKKINERLISKDGHEYDAINGVLTLKTENPENNITIQFNGNYGTF